MERAMIDDRNTVVISYSMQGRDMEHSAGKVDSENNLQTDGYKRYGGEAPSENLILHRGDVLALAHEIKNPLTNIVLSMAYLNDGDTDPERALYFEIINRSARRINDLVNGLLASKAHAFAREACHLNDLVDESLELALDRITLKKVAIHRDFTPETCVVEVDKPRFKIALLNLMVNAVEAMQTGAGQLSVATALRKDSCEITIEDNGAGIKNENLARLFDPYYSNKRSGTGIGLAVAKQIFDLHNCMTEVRSEEGKGTMFCIKLPGVLCPDDECLGK